MSTEALIAQKRAEIAAKLAAINKTNASKLATPSPMSTPAISHGASPSPAPGLPAADDVARKVAEARRLVADAQSKLAVKDNPYMVSSISLPPKQPIEHQVIVSCAVVGEEQSATARTCSTRSGSQDGSSSSSFG